MNHGEKDKLKVLLNYWIKHNKEHGAEFEEWAEKARRFGGIAVHNDLMEAHREMDKVNALLLSALEKLKEKRSLE